MSAASPAAPLTRRAVLRTAFTAAVLAGTAAALAPVLRARRPRQTVTPAPLAEEETYRGRHIAVDVAGVRIDGRPLHVMRRADGSYLSGINHFQSYPTPLEVARAAVDELGTAQLAFAAPHHG
ncbi:tyrosinase family oxidase copper chaperone [Streptomyces virginiae]|uniref:tyrosinase family oxidase copper chaperone n=1 Tax=Streptomyces virginiae TaxID=1961 RepID=UPI002259B753|nr:tyrosinase family oxidase copper chaperone [Streptomyces virginiae]MCX4717389.1 tyrosinase cofactor [Streptomyces virginiae]MCX5277239.1 tyrosinase cofactor [Streptomyces virginiae]